jgi:cytoplasmic iron level regulating protein YaaA (DUF328/UPF0246 family)
MRLDELSYPELSPLRAALVDAHVEQSADTPQCRRALGLSATQQVEVERNAALRSAPTMPAINRYTGVLYDALGIESLTPAATSRARSRLAVGSALFGVLRADDPIPAYRLSATSKLPGQPGLSTRWRPLLEPVLKRVAADELVVDLRSGSYAALGKVSDAVQVDVVSERPEGTRAVVSHFNKAHKGRLARALATSRSEPTDAGAVATIARRAGMRVERDDTRLTIVVPA